jgi:hypothetical protein
VSPTLYAAARQSVATWYGPAALLPGWFDQLSGYAVPYAPGEQGTLLSHDIPALALTAGDQAIRRPLTALDSGQLGRVGTAVANLVAELDSTPTIERDGSPVLLLSGKVMRGWLAEASMAILLAPFVACVLDLVARLRRRRVALAPGLAAFAWRLAAWLITLVAMWVVAALPGRLLPGVAIPPLPGRTGVTIVGILLAAGAGLVFWRFVSRPRLLRVTRVDEPERIGGITGGLVGLALAALLLTAVNPFALVVILPAAHIWLYLPSAERTGRKTLLAVYLAGMVGPIAIVVELWTSQGLGGSTPRALVAMTSSGYLSPSLAVPFAIAAAAAAQLGALVAGRYADPHAPVGGGPRRREL